MIYNSFSEADTIKIAQEIASKIKKGDIITLSGDLGSGKTFFTNAFINYILKQNNMPSINVISPTFNIVKTYEAKNFTIYHFDLYRLKRQDELYELDLDTAFQNLSLIEWPEIINNILIEKNVIKIRIEISKNFRKFIIE